MKHEDAELGLRGIGAHPLPRGLDVLLQLLDGVLERGAGVVDLVDDEDVLADEVLHLAEGGHVKPLGAGDFGAGHLDLGGAGELGKRLVEREADGLDGDVGAAVALEEGAQDAGGHVAAAADGDHEVRLHGGEDMGSRLLAELVDLVRGGWLSAGLSLEGRSRGGRQRAGAPGSILHHCRWRKLSRPSWRLLARIASVLLECCVVLVSRRGVARGSMAGLFVGGG